MDADARDAGPHQIVARLMDAVPPGSYLTMSDTTTDIHPDQVLDGTARLNARMGPARFTPVPLPQWRSRADPGQVISVYGCLGRKRYDGG